ncbi:hypothetical protein SAMN04489761_2685 [Tenacibaculum sp. MAR_2009_124]|uniref:hypothetical protein n=1 Tax=Tenacibaculum sp. MAR_2009_124 TaxID=1250059 RepID=UPI0008991118|nr:hypothetical protein [Tenacibaculum sp. MAR_2009_124]SEC32666.1 hypothetical protein SAMN04489761_2685 [Tenacibaculum sp. MAR_2009_124]
MTVQDIIDLIANNSSAILNYYIILGVISLVGLLIVNEDNFKNPIRYVYTFLIYAAVIPGLLSLMLIVYNLFFLKVNLLSLPVMTYYLPVAAMLVLLMIIKKTVTLKRIPGFDRLSGLFLLIFVTLIITYFVQKIFIGVFFIGSVTYLIGLFVVLLIVLKIGWKRLVK